MELPPVALISGLDNVTGELHYPALLTEQWAKCTLRQPSHDSPTCLCLSVISILKYQKTTSEN